MVTYTVPGLKTASLFLLFVMAGSLGGACLLAQKPNPRGNNPTPRPAARD